MFHFLEISTREEKKNGKRIQTSVDNTVNDLGYENKFENRVKDKNHFLLNETLLLFSFFFKYIYIYIYIYIYFIFGDVFLRFLRI